MVGEKFEMSKNRQKYFRMQVKSQKYRKARNWNGIVAEKLLKVGKFREKNQEFIKCRESSVFGEIAEKLKFRVSILFLMQQNSQKQSQGQKITKIRKINRNNQKNK